MPNRFLYFVVSVCVWGLIAAVPVPHVSVPGEVVNIVPSLTTGQAFGLKGDELHPHLALGENLFAPITHSNKYPSIPVNNIGINDLSGNILLHPVQAHHSVVDTSAIGSVGQQVLEKYRQAQDFNNAADAHNGAARAHSEAAKAHRQAADHAEQNPIHQGAHLAKANYHYHTASWHRGLASNYRQHLENIGGPIPVHSISALNSANKARDSTNEARTSQQHGLAATALLNAVTAQKAAENAHTNASNHHNNISNWLPPHDPNNRRIAAEYHTTQAQVHHANVDNLIRNAASHVPAAGHSLADPNQSQVNANRLFDEGHDSRIAAIISSTQ